MAEDLTPNISEIRKNFPSSETFNKTKPTAAQEEFFQKLRQEIINEQKRAQEILPATRKAVEEHGYLYHFAGKSARESIESKGILPGQAQGGQKSFFYLDPYNKNISEFVNAQELDLYRVPVDKQIIEQLQVDPKLGINGETAKSVFLEGDLAKQGLKAERISSKVSLAPGTGEIIFNLDNEKPIDTMTGKTATEFANGSIHYAPDGKSYFLHHSPNSTIEIGDKIRTTGFRQVTASDAIYGHSYGWDARTGLRDSVSNQVSDKGDDFSVYLTSADTKNVFPDINVPDTPARAIKGTQDVLDRVTIPAGISKGESEKLVSQMMARHGIFPEESSIGREIIDRSVLMEKGDEAVINFIKGANNMASFGHVTAIERDLASGGRRGLYATGIPEGHFAHKYSVLGDIVEKEGREAGLAHMAKMTAEEWGTDLTNYTARVAQTATTASVFLVDKADKVERFLMNRGSSRLVEASMDASAAVAGGIAKSGLLRDAAAAATILGRRL